MEQSPADEAASASGRPHIVFCISGQIRDEHVAFPAIAKLAFELDATVILSVWRRRGTKTGGIINQYQADRMFGQEFTAALPGSLLNNRAFDTAIPGFEEQQARLASPVEEQELRAWFPAAVIDIEDEILDLSFNDENVPDKNSKRMLYKIWRCNEIKSLIERQRGRRFDLVVRFRPDVIPALDDFRVAAILSDHPDETIYIPGYDETRFWADDILAVSSSEIADCYASLFGRTVLSGMPPWTISHNEIAGHLIKRGITIRPIAIQHGIIEDFAARQPVNRALFLKCLSDRRFNGEFFPRPTTWPAVHAIATAADMVAGNAPHAAIAGQLAQIDLLQEDVEFLARVCELFSISCERAEDQRSFYVSLLVGSIAEMQLADADCLATPRMQGRLEKLTRTAAALGLDPIASPAALQTALEAQPDSEVADTMAMALRSFLPENDVARHMENICAAAAHVPEDPIKTWVKFAQQGDFEGARAVAEDLIERRRNDWLGHDLLGHVFSSTGRIEEALVCARRALSLEEGNGGLVARVGSVLMLLGRYEEALPYFSRSTILWNDVRPWLWYADCLLRVGRTGDAQRVVADATARFGEVTELSALAAEMSA